MPIKDILVHADDSKACRARIATASRLARTHGADLTGLYVIPPLLTPHYAEAEIPRVVLETQEEQRLARAKEAETHFESATEGTGVTAQWRCAEAGLVKALSLYGRYADLIIVGRDDPDDPDSSSHGLADHLVLESGRPVLVVPPAGFEAIGNRVVVAWNGRREAVRATNDALPFLVAAERVEVLTVGRAPLGVPGAEVCEHLGRHGVNAQAWLIDAAEGRAGTALLERAAEQDADLVVMGAYGHSRFRELVLGGVTAHVLSHAKVPTLLSH